MKDKVVLNKDYTEILLGLAFHEGLLLANPHENDFIYEKYKTMQIDYNLAKSLLEQLLLSPKPILKNRFHKSVKGDLIDNEIFLYDEKAIERKLPTKNIPNEMFIGILNGKGIQITYSQFDEIIEQIKNIDHDYTVLQSEFGGKIPDLAITHILSLINNDSSYLKDEKYQRLINLNNIYESLQYIMNPLIEFIELQTMAEEYDAMIKIPAIFNQLSPVIKNIPVTENQTAILRLVEKEFNYISLRTTSLRETIALSNKPEFIAYRQKQDEWIGKLISGDINGIESIKKELRQAKKYIDKIPIIEQGGTFLAYIGVPLALINLPISAGLGLAVAGILPSLITGGIMENYKWAMINKINQ